MLVVPLNWKNGAVLTVSGTLGGPHMLLLPWPLLGCQLPPQALVGCQGNALQEKAGRFALQSVITWPLWQQAKQPLALLGS